MMGKGIHPMHGDPKAGKSAAATDREKSAEATAAKEPPQRGDGAKDRTAGRLRNIGSEATSVGWIKAAGGSGEKGAAQGHGPIAEEKNTGQGGVSAAWLKQAELKALVGLAEPAYAERHIRRCGRMSDHISSLVRFCAPKPCSEKLLFTCAGKSHSGVRPAVPA